MSNAPEYMPNPVLPLGPEELEALMSIAVPAAHKQILTVDPEVIDRLVEMQLLERDDEGKVSITAEGKSAAGRLPDTRA